MRCSFGVIGLFVLSLIFTGSATAELLRQPCDCVPCEPVCPAADPCNQGEAAVITDQPSLAGDVPSPPEADNAGRPSTSDQETVPQQFDNQANRQPQRRSSSDYLALGLGRGDYLTSSISPSGAALGTGTAMAFGFQVAGETGNFQWADSLNAGNAGVELANPIVSPGLLTSSNAESPYALDRVYFTYGYYDAFQVTVPAVTIGPIVVDPDLGPPAVNGQLGLTPASYQVDGFDLHRFDVGFEKTLFDGVASIYFRAPFLADANNITNQAIDGAGNLNAGLKVQLLYDQCSKDVISAGFTVSAPTSRDSQVSSFDQDDLQIDTSAPLTLGQRIDLINVTPSSVITLNPTYLQPWVAAQINGKRAFVQGYLGLIIPTDDRVVTVFNPNVSVGYRAWQGTGGIITTITPVLGMQSLLPIHDDNAELDFSEQLFVNPSLQIGLGQKTSVSAGLSTPVVGPRGFDVGATFGFNMLY